MEVVFAYEISDKWRLKIIDALGYLNVIQYVANVLHADLNTIKPLADIEVLTANNLCNLFLWHALSRART
ncbi:hypothetical protein [Paenibacillus sp. 1_12]|uniref:hypothetical protein n=1 Tax=Paenibacillus sp. 1_12 TaxID=1566278 RepID=UPI000B848ECD|nr:hypothetical protein [Paenibacillus sp. 1_12]